MSFFSVRAGLSIVTERTILADGIFLFVSVFSIISSEKELKNLTELEEVHLAKRARQREEDNE